MLHDRVPSILIVDDEAIVAIDLRETLRELGYDPYAIAASADDALARASERCPDLVLMDIRIRGPRDGIETAALLRDRFGVPIVYMTAHSDDATLTRARETEPFGYLLKPVNQGELRSVIEISLYKHQMERRLRERERWFSTTLRSIGDAVIAVDLSGKVTFMNAAAETLTGVTAADAIGRPARDVVRLLDPAQPASPLDRVLELKAPVWIEEAPLRHATSANRIIADSTSPVMDEGEMLGAVMVFRDVTERKLLQKQLELADRLASLSTLAAGIAHEVNNPLAVVMANASYVLAELERPAAVGEAARLAMIEAQRETEAAVDRIARIVSELQAFARPTTPTMGQADIAEVVRWAVSATKPALQGRATVITELGACRRVQLDDTRLGQVLVNLLRNAAHAIPVGSMRANTVAIRTRQVGSEVAIEVRDTGSGMAPEVLKRVFEPFYTTKEVGSGTGLGLAICHGIVASAGGRIEVESVPDAGTTFRIWLPTVAAPVVAAPVVAAAEAAEAPSTRRGRLAIVDDEPMMLRAMQRILRDHDVVCFSDAREALALIDRGEHFDVIFSDMMMPTMTGMDFYEELLARHPEQARRVVFITGGAVKDRVADFLAVVPNVWLSKPLPTAELRALVQERLATPSVPAPR